ncbi:MAG: hypothetical protein IPG22_05690 [Acidobacteria bacterium]|jgi:hypothetical protein|nr:hypothetical protein [Acidobacteriota bacterium]
MKAKTVKKIAHKTFAGFMALWLSGFVFLFCCETLNGQSMDMESCPLAKMSEHSDKAKQANSPVIGLTDESSMDCCGFLPIVFDKSRKINQTEKQIAPALTVVAIKFTLPTVTKITTSFPAFHKRTPDRHGTFIRNCVFRI